MSSVDRAAFLIQKREQAKHDYEKNLPKVLQRRREGQVAYDLLTEIGVMSPVGSNALREAQRRARRAVVELGLMPVLKSAMQEESSRADH